MQLRKAIRGIAYDKRNTRDMTEMWQRNVGLIAGRKFVDDRKI